LRRIKNENLEGRERRDRKEERRIITNKINL